MYASAIRGVQYFVTTYQNVELQFEVQLVGVRYGVGGIEKVRLVREDACGRVNADGIHLPEICGGLEIWDEGR